MAEEIVVSMKGIVKQFGSVVANDSVDFELRKGEIHALLGENGAGKSTLMSILYGMYRPNAGEIHVRGRRLAVGSPHEAIAHGIGMVHQHFMLVPVMSVLENIVLGMHPYGGVVGWEGIRRRVQEISQRLSLEINGSAKIHQLSVGVQQQVEILKCLYRGADVLILDEPTSVLTPQEVDRLFVLLREMASQGTSIVFITHKLDEVLALVDRVTVMRDGKHIATVDRCDTDKRQLARMMVGRDVLFRPVREPGCLGCEVLKVEDIWANDDRGQAALAGLSLTVCEGEILGIAGVDGNGQMELAEVVAGLRKPTGGRVLLSNHELANPSPSTARQAGISYVPKDRKRTGSIANFTLAENLILGQVDRAPFARHGLVQPGPVLELADRLRGEYEIRAPDSQLPARALSGGNLQKMILAREISQDPLLLVAEQPTQGLDVGATEYVYDRLLKHRAKGKAILLISTTLDEILALSDRIAVMYRGRIVGLMPNQDPNLEEIGLLMAGAGTDDLPERNC